VLSDYCNSIFYSINFSHVKCLQTIQNALARTVIKTPKHHRITPFLKLLHWQKVSQRIRYKIVYLQYSSNFSTLLYSPTRLTRHPTARVYLLNIISFPISPSSLILSQVLQQLLGLAFACWKWHEPQALLYTAPALRNGSQKISVSLLIFLTHFIISLILRLRSPPLHYTHDLRPNSSSYPIPIPLLRHHTFAIITNCNRNPTLSRFHDNSSTNISSTTLRLQTFRLQKFRLLLYTRVQDS